MSAWTSPLSKKVATCARPVFIPTFHDHRCYSVKRKTALWLNDHDVSRCAVACLRGQWAGVISEHRWTAADEAAGRATPVVRGCAGAVERRSPAVQARAIFSGCLSRGALALSPAEPAFRPTDASLRLAAPPGTSATAVLISEARPDTFLFPGSPVLAPRYAGPLQY